MPDPDRGDESAIRRIVSELRNRGPRRGVAELVARCRKGRLSSDDPWLGTVIKALCAQSTGWAEEFRSRTLRGHKCPQWLRKAISDCLLEVSQVRGPGAKLSARNIVRRDRHAQSSGTLLIVDADELGIFSQHVSLIRRLHELALQESPVDVHVRFECEHVYIHGLALLAAWSDRYAADVCLVADSPHVERYLDRTGFNQVVEDCITIQAPMYDHDHHVALTCIDRADKEQADDIAWRIVELFRRHIGLTEDVGSALQITFAELVENVYRHAESNYPAYVMAQAYPTKQMLHIAIADTGIGIFNSFRNSAEVEIRRQARTELNAIDMAVEKLVTSKTDLHKGYGLFVVRRLIERNGGTMRVMSGRVTRHFRATQGLFKKLKCEKMATENAPWRGTEVSLMFHLDRPLPLLEVYEELGPLDEAEDFFG